MNRRFVSKIGSLAALALISVLNSGCQDLNTLVTGEKFLLAPEGSPRVEVELDFSVREDFYTALGHVERQALEEALAEVALMHSDVGLRFYPVPSDAYERKDARPEYRVLIELRDLEVGVDEKTIEEEGHPTRVEARVASVSCWVSTRVEKRRRDAPALVVGDAEAQGKVRTQTLPGSPAWVDAYETEPAVVGHEGLRVEEKDLLDAFEEGTVKALRDVVKAIDRELSMERGLPL